MVIAFTRQFFTLIKAGIPLLKALQIVSAQLPQSRFREDIEVIAARIQEGMSLSDALSSSRFFSRFYVNMIKAAEVSGNMTGVLRELSAHMIRQQRIRRQVQAALMYPLLVLLMAGAIVTVLLLFVVPIFVKVFEDMGGILPPATVFLINASRFAVRWGWLAAVCAFICVLAVMILSRRERGRFIINKVIWRIPVIGHLAKLVHVGRFCRTIGTLLSSGVTLMKAIDVAGDTSLSEIITRALSHIRSRVEEGASLSLAMEETGSFPLTLVRMIQVGEETGRISEIFTDSADDYEEEVSFAVSGFLSLLEPVLILIMGAIVGFIVVALFFPVFTMSTLVK